VRSLRRIGEDEVVATYLRAELAGRFGKGLRALLARDGRSTAVVSRPNVADADDNRYRRALLDEHRGYERGEEIFEGFPRGIEWWRMALSPEEVLGILYINWEWWRAASGGSRRPADAARRIRASEIPGVTVEEHEPIAAALCAGRRPPELIAVTTTERERLVLLEGHARLTAYALFPSCLREELEIILGVSDEIARWWAF
jgi:hypothetical protein